MSYSRDELKAMDGEGVEGDAFVGDLRGFQSTSPQGFRSSTRPDWFNSVPRDNLGGETEIEAGPETQALSILGDEMGSAWGKIKKYGRKAGKGAYKYGKKVGKVALAPQLAMYKYSKKALAAISSASMWPIRKSARKHILNTAMIYARAGGRAKPDKNDKKRANAAVIAVMAKAPGPKGALLKSGAYLLKKFGTGVSGMSGDIFMGYEAYPEYIKNAAARSLIAQGKLPPGTKILANELTGSGVDPKGYHIRGQITYPNPRGGHYSFSYKVRINPEIESMDGDAFVGHDEVGAVVIASGLLAAGIAAAIMASGALIAMMATSYAKKQIGAPGGQQLGPPPEGGEGAPGEGAPGEGAPGGEGGGAPGEGAPGGGEGGEGGGEGGGAPGEEGAPPEGGEEGPQDESSGIESLMGGFCGMSCYRKGL
jgi:hypothetical protein